MRPMELWQQAERSLIKKYRKELWGPFITAIQQYQLVQAGDRIAVCISGGKDSMLMAKLMQELQRHGEAPFEAVFLCMDPGYNDENRRLIEHNAALLRIPLTFFETDVFQSAEKAGGGSSPCYLCARMRRGNLYAEARRLGCNKIALGHHFNDVIETAVMSMFYGGQLQTMPPKLHSQNFQGMELIRPLYRVREADIIAWARYHGLTFLRCACSVAQRNAALENGSKRQEVKTLLRELKKTNPNIEISIFNSVHAVCLDTFPGYKSGGETHSFLERYAEP